MGLTTAERNRAKRERKKKEKELRRKQDKEDLLKKKEDDENNNSDDDIIIEYVADKVDITEEGMNDVIEKFQQRAATSYVITDDDNDRTQQQSRKSEDEDDDSMNSDDKTYSKRQLRDILRPSVAELKRRVKRADLVEAHDVTSPDPDFLILLKALTGTVPVPRHWGRKRKYLQGKRGFEKPPFQLPDFIIKTGITELRDTLNESESGMSARQSNRQRVAPKMGQMDVDYRTLHSAFFRHQTKPTGLTRRGDLYYEGKELETRNRIQPGAPFSSELREALGMMLESDPPPWLVNMQRYGPPPSYPSLKMPGLNAPLPSSECQYGFHVGGWGKPPVDRFGRPLYGGNPFDLPTSSSDNNNDVPKEGFVTSDGKTLGSSIWGSLPNMGAEDLGSDAGNNSDGDEDSDAEMEESSESEGEEKENDEEVVVMPTPTTKQPVVDLRKDDSSTIAAEEEEPKVKELYKVLEQKKATLGQEQVFGSQIQYTVPVGGVESVLSKATAIDDKNKKKQPTAAVATDEQEGLDKNFKF